MSLCVEPGRGLIVTVPRGVSHRQVPAFVARHRQWVEARLAESERQLPERYRHWPPQQLLLPAIDRVLELSFAEGVSDAGDAASGCRPTAGNVGRTQVVHLNTSPADRTAVVKALQQVLKDLARHFFPVRLGMLADRHDLSYERVQIRGQRTRWGSCSSRGTISLNFKLLFLSPALVDYVLLHELAHTRHMNHSPAFWRQLTSMLDDARRLDGMLRDAGREVPPWMDLHSG